MSTSSAPFLEGYVIVPHNDPYWFVLAMRRFNDFDSGDRFVLEAYFRETFCDASVDAAARLLKLSYPSPDIDLDDCRLMVIQAALVRAEEFGQDYGSEYHHFAYGGPGPLDEGWPGEEEPVEDFEVAMRAIQAAWSEANEVKDPEEV
jgi:hypothetical protein